MTETVGTQAYVFLWAVMGGAVIAFLFDIFRIFRKAFKTGNLLIYIEDIIFWISVAFIMFTVVYISNDGELRSYIFLGTALGVILYALLLSRAVMLCSDLILKILGIIFRALYTAVSFPFKLLFKGLSVPAAAAGRMTARAARGVRQVGRSRLSRARIYRRMIKNKRKKI